MRKTIVSSVTVIMMLAACNNEADNKTVAAEKSTEKATPITPDTAQLAKDPAPIATAATTATWKGVQEVSDAVFAEKVLNNPGLTVVDFNATWCGPCKMLKPIFDKTANQFSGKASFASIDVDKSPTVSEKYNIESIPLLLFFKNGKVVKSIVGLVSAKELQTAVERNL